MTRVQHIGATSGATVTFNHLTLWRRRSDVAPLFFDPQRTTFRNFELRDDFYQQRNVPLF